jgi:hypothetical protein
VPVPALVHAKSGRASWLEQARGRERPVIDLPDDLLLAGVVLHDVLPGRVGLGRGPALRGGVAVAFAGVAAQPVTAASPGTAVEPTCSSCSTRQLSASRIRPARLS